MMGYRLLADVVMVVHFGYLAFLVIGGFFAWRWRWVIYPHLAAVAWGVVIIGFSLRCPLTGPEDYLRRRAGQEGLPAGFIDTYLTGVVYPEQYLGLVRAGVATLVAASWIGLIVLHRHRNAASTARS